MMIKKHIKSIVTLVCICAVVSVLMAFTNALTKDRIAYNNELKAAKALSEVMPNGGKFTEITNLKDFDIPATVLSAHSAENGGFVIKVKGKGYAPGMVIICGIDANGVITGAKYLDGGETNGAEITMSQRVPGFTAGTIDGVDTATSPTAPLTVNGYLAAIKDALTAATKLSGSRTEAEILQDNLDAALPAASGAFTKYFFTESVENITVLYKADNGAGYVAVVGESFIAINAEGIVTSEADAELKAKLEGDMAILLASDPEEIDLTPYREAGVHIRVRKASVTASGNYVFELYGEGYGVLGGDEYHPASGEFIKIRVSISADGKIIDTYTISQAETEGLGSACGEEKFYGQFDGKTEANYSDIDAIGGATMTTDGYKTAILRAFTAFNILKGGNE